MCLSLFTQKIIAEIQQAIDEQEYLFFSHKFDRLLEQFKVLSSCHMDH
jgi:hypothetical protein